jgi:hypothetical protein
MEFVGEADVVVKNITTGSRSTFETTLLKLYHSSTPQTKEYLREYQESFIDAENNPDVTAGGVSNANVNASALILDVDDGAVPSDVGAEPYDLIVGEDENSIVELFETHVVPSSPGNAIRFSDSR